MSPLLQPHLVDCQAQQKHISSKPIDISPNNLVLTRLNKKIDEKNVWPKFPWKLWFRYPETFDNNWNMITSPFMFHVDQHTLWILIWITRYLFFRDVTLWLLNMEYILNKSTDLNKRSTCAGACFASCILSWVKVLIFFKN